MKTDTTSLPTIGHVLHRLYLAGAEVLAADLSRKLSEHYRFVFLCLDQVGPLGEKLVKEGFNVINLKRNPGIDVRVAVRLRKAVEEHGIDLLHAHQYTPFFYAALSRGLGSNPPILFTEHGRHYPDYRRTKRVFANRFLLRKLDRVTAVGKFIKEMLIQNEGIPGNRIEVVYNGINPSKFSVTAGDETRRRVRAELKIDPEQPAILQVARFHPVKDHETAVRAFAAVLEADKKLPIPDKPVLLLAGDGDDRGKIETMCAELGITNSVRFLGVRTDIPELLAASDVFMLSSLSEGVSVTLLEAMGASVPIVSTMVGGNPEVVSHDETGLLSPRQDAGKLAENLLTLIPNPQLRTRMGKAGNTKLHKQFTEDQMHQRYMEIYRSMLG